MSALQIENRSSDAANESRNYTFADLRAAVLADRGTTVAVRAALGILVAYGAVALFNAQVPAFSLVTPLWAPLAAAAVSLATGLLFGLLPALRAARLDPVAALSGG